MNGIVRFSEAASIALHAMIVLAADSSREGGRLLTVREIAEGLPVSEHHLARVLQRLAKAGLVASVRGPAGGFSLRGDAARITLLDVYEAVEGRLTVPTCLFPVGEGCASCILDDTLAAANRLVREKLAGTPLSKLTPSFRTGGLVALARKGHSIPERERSDHRGARTASAQPRLARGRPKGER